MAAQNAQTDHPRAGITDQAIELHAEAKGADEEGIAWAAHQARQALIRGLPEGDAILHGMRELQLWIDLQDRIDRRVAARFSGADQFVRDAGMEA